MSAPGLDAYGRILKIGDRVRVRAIRPSILKRLAGQELADVSSMLTHNVTIFDIYEDGQVWVSLIWKKVDGTSEVHAIAVDSNSIELVGDGTANHSS